MKLLSFKPNQFVLFSCSLLLSAPVWSQKTVLDEYIQQAWHSNLVVQEKNMSLEKAKQSLEIARSYFLPEVNFIMGYQTAGGGRNIELPLGTLLNGAYTTLNQLTGTNFFPQLKDESINFFPKNFHDAKVRTTMAIVNPDRKYNREIAAQQIPLSEMELTIYKRDLARDVKQAYFQYLSSLKVISIYEQALTLAEEAKRVNQRLLENGKGLPAYVIRSESEIESVKAMLFAAKQQSVNAAYYFNFLLNREAGTDISGTYQVAASDTSFLNLQEILTGQVNARDEMKLLNQVRSIQETVLKMRKSAVSPRLNGFLDLGNQSEKWKINDQSRYYFLGLQLDIPLFTGQRNKTRVQQAEVDVNIATLQVQRTQQQLQLASSSAANNFAASRQTYHASERQLQAAAAYQRLIERGFREGVNSFIETIDARNQFTTAQLQQTINLYKMLMAAAELERQLAIYPFN